MVPLKGLRSEKREHSGQHLGFLLLPRGRRGQTLTKDLREKEKAVMVGDRFSWTCAVNTLWLFLFLFGIRENAVNADFKHSQSYGVQV